MTKPSQQTQVQHTVLFEFRDDISQDQIDEVFRSIFAFKTQEKIPAYYRFLMDTITVHKD